MLKTQFISQIYWPDFLMGQKEKGFIVGWNMENFQCCITNFVIVPEASFSALQDTLQTIGAENLLRSCSKTDSKPIILGEWIPTLPDDYTPPLAYQREGIWLTLTSRKSGPLLHSLYSCGCLHRTSCHMIRYRAVQARQLHSFSVSTSESSGTTFSSSDGHTSSSSISSHQTDLSYAVYQINNAENLGAFIYEKFPAARCSSPPLCTTHTVNNEKVMENCHTETDLLLPSISPSSPSTSAADSVSHSTPHMETWTLVMLHSSYLWLSALSLLQTLLETPMSSIFVSLMTRLLPSIYPRSFVAASPRFIRSASLKDISITCAYICERSRLLWHCLYTSIDFARKSSVSEVKSRRKQWVFVCSRLIFIYIDIFLGVLFGLYLWHNRFSLLSFIHDIGAYVQAHVLLGNLEFLNNAPYGIKLNYLLTARLSSLLGQSIVAISSGYNYFIRERYEEYLIIAISFMGCFGFSFQMLLVVDVIRSLTVHISIIHMALSVLHYFQLKSLSTLFYLFQGKKKNFLRKRIDTLETNKSQLFFGTVYFTVLCFLFPTFAAYFFLFTMLQFCVVMLQATLWGCSIMVKEFPWCELYLFFRDPHVLSHGVRIDIDYIRSSQTRANPRDPSRSAFVTTATTSKEKRRHAKKDLLRQTLLRENERMLVDERRADSRRREEDIFPEGGATKVKFSETIQTFPFLNNIISTRHSANSEKLEVPSVSSLDGSNPSLTNTSLVEESAKTEKVETVEDEGGDEDENNADTASVVSNSSDSSHSSGSSEEIGWARCHSEEDGGDYLGEDSIFAVENVWGSSDDIDHTLLKESDKCDSGSFSASEIGTDLLSIHVPEFNYCSPSDHPDTPLSPMVNRYVPTRKRLTGSFDPISSCTTYLSIQPASQSLLYHLFKPYFPYFTYWSKKRSVVRLFRGLIKGNPALDLQIIRAAVEISSSSLSLSLQSGAERGGGARVTSASSPPSPLSSSSLSLSQPPAVPPDSRKRSASHTSHDIRIGGGNGGGGVELLAASEVNAVSRSPNVFDLWSLLHRTCTNVFSIDRNENVCPTSDQHKLIFIYGVQTKRHLQEWKLETFLFCFLIFTISVCLLVALLGLCYACSPAISDFFVKLFRFFIKAIKHSKVPNVPQKGIFDIGKVHSFFSHHSA